MGTSKDNFNPKKDVTKSTKKENESECRYAHTPKISKINTFT